MKQDMSENDIGFSCPFCSTKLSISLDNIQHWIRCPKCNRPFLPDDPSSELRKTAFSDPSADHLSSGLGHLNTSPSNMLDPQEANSVSDHITSAEVLGPPVYQGQTGDIRVLKSKIITPSQVNPMTSLKRLVIILLKSWLFIKAARLLLFQILFGIGWYYPEELAFYTLVMLISLFPRWFDLSHDS